MNNIKDTNQAPPKEPFLSEMRFFTEGNRWGTKLDKLSYKEMPTKYIGKSFSKINNEDLRSFFSATNKEKFEMAYWLEKSSSRRASTFGIIIGVILVIVIVGVFYYLLDLYAFLQHLIK